LTPHPELLFPLFIFTILEESGSPLFSLLSDCCVEEEVSQSEKSEIDELPDASKTVKIAKSVLRSQSLFHTSTYYDKRTSA
jgi:hypothetical protein